MRVGECVGESLNQIGRAVLRLTELAELLQNRTHFYGLFPGL